jgi:hypothetical protein
MGAMTLAGFRRLLLANPNFQSSEVIDNEMIDDCIHNAYLEVTGASDFDGLKKCASLSTVDGTTEYGLPIRFAGMIGVSDQTSGGLVLRTDLRNMLRFSLGERGYPKYWARKHDAIVLWPEPDGVYDLFVYFLAEPARMTAGTDVTVLPASWDKVVLELARENLLRALGEFDAADKTFTRAIALSRSRTTEDENNAPKEGPLRIVTSMEQLLNSEPTSERF